MHILYKLVCFFTISLLACSQPDRKNNYPSLEESVKATLLMIRHVPSRYTDTILLGRKKVETTDTVFNRLIEMDTAAIKPLIGVLADTTETQVYNPCGKSRFTVGQLAMLIIVQIEFIPFARVTGMQFDAFECGAFPEGLLEYVREHGVDFQGQYRSY